MTTYNTYQEAKIANPESNIYIHTGEFWCEKSIRPSSWTYESRGFKLCNPTDHCMTVERFLADGYRFVDGDLVLGCGDRVMEVCGLIHLWNSPEDADARNLILRAAALEDKKPRTKVEYVKCEFSREWEAVKYYNEEGELFVIDCNGNYSNVNDISGAWYEVVCKNLGSLYRAVHIDIDWRDDAIYHFNTTPSLHEDDRLIDLISKSATKQESDAFIKLCHLVSSLNSVN